MVVENLTDIQTLEVLVRKVSNLSTLFQAIGGLILAYIIFNIINTYNNRKKRNELKSIRLLLEKIDKNIEKLAMKIKK